MPASRRTLGLVLLAAAGLAGCARHDDAPLVTDYPRTDPATWGAHAWRVLRWGMGPGDADLLLRRDGLGGTFVPVGAIGRDPRGQRYTVAGASIVFGGTPSVVELLFLDDRLFEVALWRDGPRDLAPLARWREPEIHLAWAALERAGDPATVEAPAPDTPADAERRAVTQLALVLRSAAWERRVYGRAATDPGWARDEFLAACGAQAPADACRLRLALVERRPTRFVSWDGRWDELERAEKARLEKRKRASAVHHRTKAARRAAKPGTRAAKAARATR